MGILLFENNGFRVVWMKPEQQILFECQGEDSLGVPQWQTMRRILPYTDYPSGRRENLLFDILLGIFDAVNPNPQQLQQQFIEQQQRRLEVDNIPT